MSIKLPTEYFAIFKEEMVPNTPNLKILYLGNQIRNDDKSMENPHIKVI